VVKVCQGVVANKLYRALKGNSLRIFGKAAASELGNKGLDIFFALCSMKTAMAEMDAHLRTRTGAINLETMESPEKVSLLTVSEQK